MQLELVNIIEILGVICVMVIYDQEEVMMMVICIVVMDVGWIQQVGKLDEIYEQFVNCFVVEFIGLVNLFDGVIDEDLFEYVMVCILLFLVLIYVVYGIIGYEGQLVVFVLCLEKVMIGKDEFEGVINKVQGVIEDIVYFGSYLVYYVCLFSGVKVLFNFVNLQCWVSDGLIWGDSVWVYWCDNDGVVFIV